MTPKPLASQMGIYPLPASDPRVREALFTFREAAAYLRVPLSTLSYWTRHARSAGGTMLVTGFPAESGVPSLPFVGLAEAYVLAAFRKAGVPIRRITPALEKLKEDVGLEYALASGHLYTDGVEVLFDYASQADEHAARTLAESRSGQVVLRPIVSEYLRRIQWDAHGWPERLHLPGFSVADVIVDVRRAYGRPLVVRGDARVEDLVGRWRGGDSLADIATDFGVPPEEVEDVVRVGIQSRAA
jgi:uncharacterized protein (DUF433 family)